MIRVSTSENKQGLSYRTAKRAPQRELFVGRSVWLKSFLASSQGEAKADGRMRPLLRMRLHSLALDIAGEEASLAVSCGGATSLPLLSESLEGGLLGFAQKLNPRIHWGWG